ncbi:methylated-DNA--[protein]-cysteine S-methyltransferase [Candidatus Gracilibacteria bacterium]|nr:methylated-DNA--[protein]-cysteine S-methyltransferase [Candidatus Gracilibacteria bacterium]
MQLYHSIIASPIGDLYAVADNNFLLLLEFGNSGELENKTNKIEKKYQTRISAGINHILEKTTQELQEYFNGKRKHFDIPLQMEGTQFQQKSWEALKIIPYAETRNYSEQALMTGSPKAVRAIGGANHNNPIVIIVPCHRVIGKSGKLVGYGGGMDRKIWLLEHEKNNI